jgi:hypothetical protein
MPPHFARHSLAPDYRPLLVPAYQRPKRKLRQRALIALLGLAWVAGYVAGLLWLSSP